MRRYGVSRCCFGHATSRFSGVQLYLLPAFVSASVAAASPPLRAARYFLDAFRVAFAGAPKVPLTVPLNVPLNAPAKSLPEVPANVPLKFNIGN